MSYKFLTINNFSKVSVLTILLSVLMISGCGVEAAKTAEESAKTNSIKNVENAKPNTTEVSGETLNSEPKSAIDIKMNSPADTVRVFYKRLKENKFREALVLTNLRPAIEGLTETEVKDLQVDFGHLSRSIPTNFVINGEIIVGEKATVTINLPDEDTGEMITQEIKLRREGDFWTILTLDENTEQAVKKQGKNYFFALRIDTHHKEAKSMIERIFKAQLIYSAQNGGTYGNIQTLVNKGFLPEDIQTSTTTGYNYNIELSADKKTYDATAIPEIYGKTGKLSYLLYVDANQNPHFEKEDKKGKLLKR